MKILLDTHFLLWMFISPEKISGEIKNALLDKANDIYYSQASLWEISIKYALGKLELQGGTPEDFYKGLRKSTLMCKYLDNEDLSTFYKLPKEHKDPFDRILIWQAINSKMTFLSVDSKMDLYKKHGLKVF